ncbi:MAG: archaeosine biosynthesis radical SAM protein RaSEA [Methanolinea sp.]|nr:archaeosine biosynthesis radical SAM protein RaSEA [Methanolinea sp.]
MSRVTVQVYAGRPYAAWISQENIGGRILPTLTVILKTGGCRWNRCRMCSYRHVRLCNTGERELVDALVAQARWVEGTYRLDGIECVKVYTSGSFFDPREVPPAARDAIGRMFRGKIVIAETRPEFVEEESVASFMETIDDGRHDTPLYVAMGLETSDDFVREKCIDKGFTWEDFISAAGRARSAGAGVKAYLLGKPPFLTEKEAMEDNLASEKALRGIADMVSLNPCSVQNGTELERYWRRGEYRPAYLWTVLSVLSRAGGHVLCDPLHGGRERGAHNCGRCDPTILRGIRDYSLSGDKDLLGDLLRMECPCRQEWEFVLSRERPYCMPLTR